MLYMLVYRVILQYHQMTHILIQYIYKKNYFQEVPFPSEGDLQRKLQDHVNWQVHRKLTYNQLTEYKRIRDAKKKQFTPQYIGQYNYRTGP